MLIVQSCVLRSSYISTRQTDISWDISHLLWLSRCPVHFKTLLSAGLAVCCSGQSSQDVTPAAPLPSLPPVSLQAAGNVLTVFFFQGLQGRCPGSQCWRTTWWGPRGGAPSCQPPPEPPPGQQEAEAGRASLAAAPQDRDEGGQGRTCSQPQIDVRVSRQNCVLYWISHIPSSVWYDGKFVRHLSALSLSICSHLILKQIFPVALANLWEEMRWEREIMTFLPPYKDVTQFLLTASIILISPARERELVFLMTHFSMEKNPGAFWRKFLSRHSQAK